MGSKRGRSALRLIVIALISATIFAGVVFAADYAAGTYSSGTYGGGVYGTGDATPPTTPAPSGGGGMIVGSGPLAPSASSFFTYIPPGFQTITAAATVVPPVATSIGSTTAATPYAFSKNHRQGDTGADILALQQFLNAHGFQVASSGPGSPGNETSIFGSKTYRALIKFQAANNLPATGYFGPLTRALINSEVR